MKASLLCLLACVLFATAIRTNNDKLEDVEEDLQRLYKENPVSKCDKLDSHYEPKNIYDLRVNSISVIAAFGDSISAGFGMHGKTGTLEEYRGESAPIGGDDDAITQATFLKHYNPSLYGYSKGKHWLEWAGDDHEPEQDVLNAAQSGAETRDLAQEAAYFLQELNKSKVDIANDWKLINLFIGANDACHLCEINTTTPVEIAASAYASNIESFLKTMKANVPRTLINIWPVFNISSLYYQVSNVTYCSLVHDVVTECSCAFSEDANRRNYLDSVLTAYRSKLFDIQKEWTNVADDFAVVVQPFTTNCTVKEEYLSTLDCFHPNVKGHQLFAVNAWNALITPPAQKKWYLEDNPTFLCPTQDTLLYTPSS